MVVLDIIAESVKVLLEVVEAVKCNQEQCELIGRRCNDILQEFQRLPPTVQEELESRNIFSNFKTVVESAVDLCEKFEGKHWLKKIVKHNKYVGKFEEVNKRLKQVVADASLGLAFDQKSFNAAQQQDDEFIQQQLANIMQMQEENTQLVKDEMLSIKMMLEKIALSGSFVFG